MSAGGGATQGRRKVSRGLLLLLAALLLAIGGGVLYLAWLEDTAVPPGPPDIAGGVLFETKRCIRCHKVAERGGLVGPDLTGVALKRDAGWLDAYLVEPRALVPDGTMPAPRLTPAQRAAVVAYLRTLRPSPSAAPDRP